jgi:hypothetical protein
MKDGNYHSKAWDMERSDNIDPEKEYCSSGQRQGMIRRCTCTSEERRCYVPMTLCLTRTRLCGVTTQRPQYEPLAWKTSCLVQYIMHLVSFFSYLKLSHKLQEVKKNIFLLIISGGIKGERGQILCSSSPNWSSKSADSVRTMIRNVVRDLSFSQSAIEIRW